MVTAILTYLSLTIPAYFQQTHILRNLEPYPDGLLYSLSARNFAEHGRLRLEYRDTSLDYWVRPLYAIMLIPGYLISSDPAMFYVSNIFFGVITLYIISKICWKLTQNKLAVGFAILVYLLHGYILWLPVLPMAENASLLFFSATIYFIIATQNNWKTALSSLIFSGALFFSKSAATLTVLFLNLTTAVLLLKNIKYKYKSAFIIISLCSLAVLPIIKGELFYPIFDRIHSIILNQNPYFSLNNLNTNASSYLEALVGIRGDFLWWNVPLSSLSLLVIFLCTPIWLKLRKQHEAYIKSLILVGIFLSQFVILLLFYEVDARYSIYTIPLFVIQFAVFLSLISKKSIMLLIGGISLIVLTIQQKPLLQEFVAANILGRSNSWQYQSIKHFDRYFSKVGIDRPYLITTLPPFLVEAYQTEEYQLLPLSYSQEFLQKKEYVWGSDLDYTNLNNIYEDLLKSDQDLYISNSYITHQQSVVSDFESYKSTYNFELVSEGCLSACNIYKLSLVK